MITQEPLTGDSNEVKWMNTLIDRVHRESLIGYLQLPSDMSYWGFSVPEDIDFGNVLAPICVYIRDRHAFFRGWPAPDNGYDFVVDIIACDDESLYFQCATLQHANMIIAALRYMPKEQTIWDVFMAMGAKVNN